MSHSLGGGAWFACRVDLVSQSVSYISLVATDPSAFGIFGLSFVDNFIEAALAAPRPAKEEATRGAVLIDGPICRHLLT